MKKRSVQLRDILKTVLALAAAAGFAASAFATEPLPAVPKIAAFLETLTGEMPRFTYPVLP